MFKPGDIVRFKGAAYVVDFTMYVVMVYPERHSYLLKSTNTSGYLSGVFYESQLELVTSIFREE